MAQHKLKILPPKSGLDWLIIGKHPNAPKQLAELNHLDAYNSIGLNEAAALFRTRYAITGHGSVLDRLHANGVQAEQIIGVLSPFDPLQIWQGSTPRIGDFIRHDWQPEFSQEQMDAMVQAARENRDINYGQWWSVLHLAVFYALKKGAQGITIIGCDHTPGTLPGMVKGAEEHFDMLRRHTEMLVKSCGAVWVRG